MVKANITTSGTNTVGKLTIRSKCKTVTNFEGRKIMGNRDNLLPTIFSFSCLNCLLLSDRLVCLSNNTVTDNGTTDTVVNKING